MGGEGDLDHTCRVQRRTVLIAGMTVAAGWQGSRKPVAGCWHMLKPGGMIGIDHWPSIVFTIRHKLLEVVEHEDLDVWRCSGHDCHVPILKSHAGEVVVDGPSGLMGCI